MKVCLRVNIGCHILRVEDVYMGLQYLSADSCTYPFTCTGKQVTIIFDAHKNTNYDGQ